MAAGGTLTASERDWLRVRSYLTGHRHDLAVRAAADHPDGTRVAGTPLLAAPRWRLPAPVPLGDIGTELGEIGTELGDSAPHALPPPRGLPERADGTRYARYSDAMRELAAPAVFENRSTYRLTGADLAGSPPRLSFALGRYFDGIDTGEAAAHEYAATRLGELGPSLRASIGDPCDLRRRPANLAISTLTIRLDRATGEASFLLHWRDPAKVGHAGGLYQVIPVGVFQPSGEAPRHRREDFSLWRCMLREFAEELGGQPEDHGADSVDYGSWPFARRMSQGLIGAWCLGLGVDPLTFATDLLTVAVIDSRVFDDLFGAAGAAGAGPWRNAEGTVLRARPFSAGVIEHFAASEPVQAAGAAVLRLAWRHRAVMVG